jgi:filamentous hemagglutinin
MGAAASSMLGTLLGPTQGLTQRQKEAQTNLVSSLVAAVAGMAGQDTQTATTAAVTEGRFNRQLHSQERKWISDREAVYARRYGLTAEQAREELTIQANLQVQSGSAGEWNQRAHEFLKQAHGMMPADGESGPGYMFYATPEQKADPSMYAGHYPSGVGLNAPSSEVINASVNRDAASRDVMAKQTLGAAAGAGTIVLAPKVAMAAGLGTGYDYAGDVISRAMGLSNDGPNAMKSLVVGGVVGVTAPFFLPLSTLGGSTAGKIVVGGYNSLLAGTGAFAGTAITQSGNPDLSAGIGLTGAALSQGINATMPGPAGAFINQLIQVLSGPAQAVIETNKNKE